MVSSKSLAEIRFCLTVELCWLGIAFQASTCKFAYNIYQTTAIFKNTSYIFHLQDCTIRHNLTTLHKTENMWIEWQWPYHQTGWAFIGVVDCGIPPVKVTGVDDGVEGIVNGKIGITLSLNPTKARRRRSDSNKGFNKTMLMNCQMATGILHQIDISSLQQSDNKITMQIYTTWTKRIFTFFPAICRLRDYVSSDWVWRYPSIQWHSR